MWIPLKAKIKYDPPREGLRKTRPGSLVVAEVDHGLAAYYRWWVKKRFGLALQHTAFTPHVTIIHGKYDHGCEKKEAWKKYEGQIIDLEYSVDIEQHWKFWVLPVRSNDIAFIRQELGLDFHPHLHITIGRMV